MTVAASVVAHPSIDAVDLALAEVDQEHTDHGLFVDLDTAVALAAEVRRLRATVEAASQLARVWPALSVEAQRQVRTAPWGRRLAAALDSLVASHAEGGGSRVR